MLEAVALVTDLLLLAVPLDRLRVPLPILLLVVGMCVAPLFPAFLHHLSIEGIGANLFAVIIPAALPLAWGLAANQLFRVIEVQAERLADSEGSDDDSSSGSGSECKRCHSARNHS